MRVEREKDTDIPSARSKLVSDMIDMVKRDKSHWASTFKQMKANKKFASGDQWPGEEKFTGDDRSYVANITHRHIKQRTASIYARNPRFNFRKTKRLNYKIWDGTAQSLIQAQTILAENPPPEVQKSIALLMQDAQEGQQRSKSLDRVGQTLTLLYEYYIREQATHTKTMMKRQVQTALTSKVGYIKQGYQRILQQDPDITRQIADHRSNLDIIEQISEDIDDEIITNENSEAEKLRLMIQDLEAKPEILLREGLTLDYPEPDKIIPDSNMVYLPEFVGCDHVTEEYDLTKQQVQQTYNIDVGDGFDNYVNPTDGSEGKVLLVWEIWVKSENMVYVVIDGYDNFLIEPSSPDVWTERFWPWFPYVPNATADSEKPYPASDVELIMPMQMEINRAGEALRDHRWAARPGHVVGSNMPAEDSKALQARSPHAVITLKGLGPDEDISKKLQPIPVSPFDQNLYNTGPAFQDIMRAIGTQEANLGRASGATATETSIAESSRQSSLSSAIDELDDLLSMMAHSGGQILMQTLDEETVKQIVGPGALWPQQDIQEIAQEIFLEVEAGSSGRPNQSQDIQVRERAYPLLFQIPGIKSEYLLKDMLRVMDDGIVYEDAIDVGAPSIIALNGQAQADANKGGSDNAERPPGGSAEGPPRPVG